MRLDTELPKITIILLNYKRPQNIPIILKAIRSQTVKSIVFLWNNGDVDVNSPLIDRYERSSKNVGCMVRWKLAKEATTPYVMSLDDDICFNRNDALENIIQSLEKQDNPNRIVGFVGACFNSIPIYIIRREFICRCGDLSRQTRRIDNTYKISLGGENIFVKCSLVTQDAAVDIVKGRVMAFRKQLLDDITLPEEREDDIFLSAAFANKARKFHRIPALLNDAFYELPEFATGNWYQQGHFLSRDRALKAHFSPNAILNNWLTRYIFISAHIIKILLLRILNLLK